MPGDSFLDAATVAGTAAATLALICRQRAWGRPPEWALPLSLSYFDFSVSLALVVSLLSLSSCLSACLSELRSCPNFPSQQRLWI